MAQYSDTIWRRVEKNVKKHSHWPIRQMQPAHSQRERGFMQQITSSPYPIHNPTFARTPWVCVKSQNSNLFGQVVTFW